MAIWKPVSRRFYEKANKYNTFLKLPNITLYAIKHKKKIRNKIGFISTNIIAKRHRIIAFFCLDKKLYSSTF